MLFTSAFFFIFAKLELLFTIKFTMEENQEQFIGWLAEKLSASDDEDLKNKLKQLGDTGIKQAYDEFLAQQAKLTAIKSAGGKLDYIQCLQEFKKGGKLKASCGCGGMKVSTVKRSGGIVEPKTPDINKKPKALNPKKVVMGQGMGTISNIRSHQQGGQAQPKSNMQVMSPEQVEKQKIEEKTGELLQKKKGKVDTLSLQDQLKIAMKPKQIKAKPEKTITLVSKNNVLYGIDRK